MYKVKVNNKKEHLVLPDGKGKGTINGQAYSIDMIKVKDGRFHVIMNDRSFNAEVVKADPKEKSFTLLINNHKYNITVKDKYDELLASLGMDLSATKKVKQVKAPMPGMVLEIIVAERAEVKKGDPLIILEAMKMENILKSPSDGVVSKIDVKKGVAVEKNQVLIHFN